MNKWIWIGLIGILGWVTNVNQSSAQVNIKVNIGSQPLWGPIGYQHVDYYYLPDIESYYYVPTRQFVYLSNGRWIFGANLPARYGNYDLYRGYKVVMNHPRPYLEFRSHIVQYKKYKGYSGKQSIIKYSNDPKYYIIKGHPHEVNHDQYKKDNDKGNSGHQNNGKGHH